MFPFSIGLSSGQFQPGEIQRVVTLEPLADSYVDPENAALNFGAADELRVSNDSGILSTTYLKFDVPEIELTDFLGADLILRLKGKSESTTSTIAVYLVNRSLTWDELRINFLNAPEPDNQTVAINDRVAFKDTWLPWNIAVTISSLVEEGGGEITFALRSMGDTGEDAFFSKDSRFVPHIEIRSGFSNAVPDTQPPVFGQIWVEPAEPSVEDPIEILAEITDQGSGIRTVILQYILSSDVNWIVDEMEPIGTIYHADIARQPSNSTFFFFIDATDFAGNSISSEVMTFSVTRPLYYKEIQLELDQKDLELNQTRSFFEDQIADNEVAFQEILGARVGLLEEVRDGLVEDLEELLADYDLLLLNYTRLLRNSGELDASYDRVLSLYNQVREQYGEVELAYQGQREIEDELRASLDDLR